MEKWYCGQLSGRDNYGFNSVLNDVEVILALDQLQSEFVLVPTDKASNNVTIVCKKFYVSLIQKELTSSNFIVDTRSGDDIIKEHSVFCQGLVLQCWIAIKSFYHCIALLSSIKTQLASV